MFAGGAEDEGVGQLHVPDQGGEGGRCGGWKVSPKVNTGNPWTGQKVSRMGTNRRLRNLMT